MKLLKTLLAASLLSGSVLVAAPAAAQMRPLADPVVPHPDPESLFTSSDPKLHRNKQAALHIVRELLQCNQWSRAGEWLTDRYIQHNPLAGSGLAPVIHYFVNVAKREPTPTCDKLTNPVVAVQAEGDYVTVMFVRELPIPGYPGETYTTTWFDSWRFVDGKADEHWDPATLPAIAPPTPEAQLKEAVDRAQINQLMWDYVRAIDSWNADAYAAVFTEDGAFGQTKGREALQKMVVDMKAGREKRAASGETVPDLHHVMTNQQITFTGPNSARVKYYWQTVSAGSPGGATPVLLAQGRGQDDVVRVDGKWLIKYRNVAPTDG